MDVTYTVVPLGRKVGFQEQESGNDNALLLFVRGMGVFCELDKPHVHVHYLFDDGESNRLRYTAHEYACHFCGKSLTVFADFSNGFVRDLPSLINEFHVFKEAHTGCPPSGPHGVSYLRICKAALEDGDSAVFCPELRVEQQIKDFRTLGPESLKLTVN